MCGIVGLLHTNGAPISRDLLGHMTAMLAHRGPEGRGLHLFSDRTLHVGLGHTRLRVLDLSDAANQPMVSDDRAVAVVFNGEIYNFRELRGELEAAGCRFRTTSDTEVLLRLYEARGETGLSALEGMFAFGIWDGHRRSLILGRDRVGKKPLYYCDTPGQFAFASEIKALLAHPGVPAELDAERLPALFLFGYVPMPQTLYRGIRQLPPGHRLRVDVDGGRQLTAYWQLPSPDDRLSSLSDEDAATGVRQRLTDAVRRRLIADVPLGAFLSGGIDSSIVVGLMSQLVREPVRTFSIGFAGDRRYDETSYARLVAKRFGTTHTEFIVQPSAVQLLEQLVWHYDGPFADSSAIPTFLLSKLTREHVTVALTGDGGDELFAGYVRFAAAVLSERVPAWARRAVALALGRLPQWGGERGAFGRLRKFAGSAALPFDERFHRWVSVFYEDLPRLLPACPRPVSSILGAPSPAQGTLLSRLLRLNLRTYLLDDLLVKMDRSSMAHALETRSPFLDRELLEYAFRLPDRFKLQGTRTKVILRRAFADLLPTDILTRGKMGFGVPLHAWFRHDLREFVHDTLLAPQARSRAYVHQPFVRQLYEQHLTGRADHAHRLWTLLTFEIWLRQLEQGRGRPPARPVIPAEIHGTADRGA